MFSVNTKLNGCPQLRNVKSATIVLVRANRCYKVGAQHVVPCKQHLSLAVNSDSQTVQLPAALTIQVNVKRKFLLAQIPSKRLHFLWKLCAQILKKKKTTVKQHNINTKLTDDSKKGKL